MKKLIFVFVALFCMISCAEQKTKSVETTINDSVVVDSAVVDSVVVDSVVEN